MESPSVTLRSGLLYEINFAKPNPGGVGINIEAYELVFRRKDGEYATTAACNGTL